jgi:hypothetical protein
MESLCQYFRRRIDANHRKPVTLPVEEIRIRRQHGAEYVHDMLWWVVRNAPRSV